MKTPYDHIDDEMRLLKAYVEVQLSVIARVSSSISEDAKLLKVWFEQYLRFRAINPPEIDWSPYILD